MKKSEKSQKIDDIFEEIIKACNDLLTNPGVKNAASQLADLQELATQGKQASNLTGKIQLAKSCLLILQNIIQLNPICRAVLAPHQYSLPILVVEEDLLNQINYLQLILQKTPTLPITTIIDRLAPLFTWSNEQQKNVLTTLFIATYAQIEEEQNKAIADQLHRHQVSYTKVMHTRQAIRAFNSSPANANADSSPTEIALDICDDNLSDLKKKIKKIQDTFLKKYGIEEPFNGPEGYFQGLDFDFLNHRWLRSLYKKVEKTPAEGVKFIEFLKRKQNDNWLLIVFIKKQFGLLIEENEAVYLKQLENPLVEASIQTQFFDFLCDLLKNLSDYDHDFFASYGSSLPLSGANRSTLAAISTDFSDKIKEYHNKTLTDISSIFNQKLAMIIADDKTARELLPLLDLIQDLQSTLINAQAYLTQFFSKGINQQSPPPSRGSGMQASLAPPAEIGISPRSCKENVDSQLIFLSSYLDALVQGIKLLNTILKRLCSKEQNFPYKVLLEDTLKSLEAEISELDDTLDLPANSPITITLLNHHKPPTPEQITPVLAEEDSVLPLTPLLDTLRLERRNSVVTPSPSSSPPSPASSTNRKSSVSLTSRLKDYMSF